MVRRCALTLAAFAVYALVTLVSGTMFGVVLPHAITIPVVFAGWRQGRWTALLATGFGLALNMALFWALGFWEDRVVTGFADLLIGHASVALVGFGAGVASELLAGAKRLVEIKDASGDLLLVARVADGQVVDANLRARKLLDDPVARGVHLRDLDPQLNIDALLEHARRPDVATSPVQAQLAVDGVQMPVDVIPRRVQVAGDDLLVLAIRDVSVERALLQQLTASDERAEAAEQEAQVLRDNRLAQLGTMAASMAHEIANPLTFVIANVDHLREALYPDLQALLGRGAGRPDPDAVLEELSELLDDLQLGSERIRDITRDLKLFARQEKEEVVDDLEVSRVLQETLRLSRHHFEPGVTLSSELADGLLVRGDEGKLSQVVLNLLTNAAHAVQGRAIKGVSLHLFRKGDNVCIEVKDTGHGMPQEVIEKIFRPFFTTKPQGEGTGLGLSVCKNIIEEMGGLLEVESTVDVGTVFRITLPRTVDEWAEPTEETARTPSEERYRLLIVDDEPSLAKGLARILSREYDTTAAQGGAEALKLLETQTFDIVVSDVMMPDMNGVALYREVQRRHPALAARFLFMSGGTYTPEATTFIGLHADRVLYKPLDRALLQELIEERLAAAPTVSNRCPNVDRCPLFERFAADGLLSMYRENYCDATDGGASQCARLAALKSGARPPDTLLPDGRHLPELETEERPRLRVV